MPDTSAVYRPRKPQDSQYYQCVEDNFEILEQVYDALEWLAAMCSHVPNKGEQMVRYYGFYSPAFRGMARGKRKKNEQDELIPSILESEGHPGNTNETGPV